MDTAIARSRGLLIPFVDSTTTYSYLLPDQLNALTEAFQSWYDSSPNQKVTGRYWSVFLVLRFTAARISEVLQVDDKQDMDIRRNKIRLITLKQFVKSPKTRKKTKKRPTRLVPVPPQVVNEISRYLVTFPSMQGRVFKLDGSNFRKVFRSRCDEAKIPKDHRHPHILRHSRAMELITSGVPINGVQRILGHSSIATTSDYLQISDPQIEEILREKGLI